EISEHRFQGLWSLIKQGDGFIERKHAPRAVGHRLFHRFPRIFALAAPIFLDLGGVLGVSYGSRGDMKKLTFLAFIALLLVGASTSSAKTFNWKDVREMSEAGVPDDIIIQKINATDLVFELKADEIIDLWEAGVSEKVITAMLKTEAPVDEERGEEILQDQKDGKDQGDKDEDNGYDNRS